MAKKETHNAEEVRKELTSLTEDIKAFTDAQSLDEFRGLLEDVEAAISTQKDDWEERLRKTTTGYTDSIEKYTARITELETSMVWACSDCEAKTQGVPHPHAPTVRGRRTCAACDGVTQPLHALVIERLRSAVEAEQKASSEMLEEWRVALAGYLDAIYDVATPENALAQVWKAGATSGGAQEKARAAAERADLLKETAATMCRVAMLEAALEKAYEAAPGLALSGFSLLIDAIPSKAIARVVDLDALVTRAYEKTYPGGLTPSEDEYRTEGWAVLVEKYIPAGAVVVVDSRSPYAAAVLKRLIPKASVVVRGRR